MADKTGKVEGKDMCTDVANINGAAIDTIKGLQGKDKKSCVTCTAIGLAAGRSCDEACAGRECVNYYTDGTVGSLIPGNKLYTDSNCENCVGEGVFSDRPCRGIQGVCIQVRECVMTRIDRC